MPTFAVSSPWKTVFCYCMVSLTRLFYRSSPSLNEVFLFTIFLVLTEQQTHLFPSLLIQLYPIVLFQLSPLHFTLSLTYSDFASFWDSVLVPDLQKAIPWSRAAGHPIRCHANTAHSVVMTRQHSCKRQTLFLLQIFLHLIYIFIVLLKLTSIFVSLSSDSPTLSALSVSQMLQLKSSYPARMSLPEREGAREVTPHMMLESWNVMSSWSERRSYSLQEASSEPVITALPLGKNWKVTERKMYV